MAKNYVHFTILPNNTFELSSVWVMNPARHF